jgi:hypothetical protein
LSRTAPNVNGAAPSAAHMKRGGPAGPPRSGWQRDQAAQALAWGVRFGGALRRSLPHLLSQDGGLGVAEVGGDAHRHLDHVVGDEDVDEAPLPGAAASATAGLTGGRGVRERIAVSRALPEPLREDGDLDVADVRGHADRHLDGVVDDEDVDETPLLLCGGRCRGQAEREHEGDEHREQARPAQCQLHGHCNLLRMCVCVWRAFSSDGPGVGACRRGGPRCGSLTPWSDATAQGPWGRLEPDVLDYGRSGGLLPPFGALRCHRPIPSREAVHLLPRQTFGPERRS